MILDEIVEHKKTELVFQQKNEPLEKLQSRLKNIAKSQAGKIGFKQNLNALHKNDFRLIAEVKKASPSKGIICADFDHTQIARFYENHHASAVSVLTDEHFFKGNLRYLADIAQQTDLPVLRKDFIISEYQIYQAKAYGAAAILLIAAILSDHQLHEFSLKAKALGMDCLVEVHDHHELKRVLSLKDVVIGVNNRNLQNFQVDLNTVKQLSSLVPAKRILISESGILTYQDLAEVVEQARISGFLIGEGLCNDRQNMAANFTEIFGPCPGSLSCKICGITSLADAQAVVKSGFSALGFIFYKKSPRYIPPQLARSVSLQLGINIKRVGVFVNERAAVVKEIARQAHLDYLQFHGDEDPAYLAEFDDFKIIKAVSGDYTAKQLAQYRVDYFLVDNITSQQRGGTGQTANWEFARELARDYPVILSGGLNGANVGTARQRVAPAALDFNSGVETKPGQKDVKKLRRLAQKLKEMDAL